MRVFEITRNLRDFLHRYEYVYKSNIAMVIYMLLLSCMIEVFVFNFRYFDPIIHHAHPEYIEPGAFIDVHNAEMTNQGFIINQNDAAFSIKPNISTPVYCLKIQTNEKKWFTASVSFVDEDSAIDGVSAGDWTVAPKNAYSSVIHLRTEGTAKKLTFKFSNISSSVLVKSVEINVPYMNFSIVRMALIFFVFVVIGIFKKKRVFRINISAVNCKALIIGLAVVFAIWVITDYILCSAQSDFYEFTSYAGGADAYKLLTQAITHGQLHYLLNPSQELLQLSDPYNCAMRLANNVGYIWDSALFDGKYYCYFGIAPAILLLVPFRMITGLYMPTSLAVLVFLILTGAAVLYLYRRITQRLYPNIGLIPFFAGATVLLFGSSLFWWLASRPMFYELAEAAGLCFLFWGISMVYDVYSSEKPPIVRMILSGIFFGLCMASRPNLAPYISVAMILWFVMYKRTNNIKQKLKVTCMMFAPFMFVMILLVIYNFVRFGSPIEFGQKYQLTVNDTRFNSLSNYALFFTNGFHYLFQSFQLDTTFPFFHIVQQDFPSTAGWYYNSEMVGLFNFPILLILLVSVPVIKKVLSRTLKYVMSITLICATFILYVDSVKGGVVERYLLDLQPTLTLLSIMIWFELREYFKRKQLHRQLEKVFVFICIITIVISSFSTFSGEWGNIQRLHPAAFLRLSQFFEFWK